ncbi:MAG: division/cell wall cluster transcriptional repressor MraZ [Anaerolineae bacterium]
MFLGEFTHALDEKGRLTIPAKFREELAGGLVITRGIDRCLSVYPRPVWDSLAERIAKLPLTQRSARDFGRLMFSGAADFIPDRQGRVLIPQGLRDYAGLNSDAIIIGLYDRLEIWNPEHWASVRANVEADPESLAEQLQELGI